MLFQQVALPRLPAYTRITHEHLEQVLRRMSTDEAELQQTLDAGFRRMEVSHPALAEYLSLELSEVNNRAAQGLTYFLAITQYLCFETAFGKRLGPITQADVRRLANCLLVDGELRNQGVCGDSYSEDLIALAQPELCAYLRDEISQGETDGGESPVPYAALLLTLIALSQSVEPGSDVGRAPLLFL